MRNASALAEQEPLRIRGRDSHGPSRGEGTVRATRQRFWPVEAQPLVTDQPDADRGLLYTWRRQIQEGMAEHRTSPGTAETRHPPEATQNSARQDNHPLAEHRGASGVIAIDLPNGVCVRVDNQVDPVALRRVLDALRTQELY